MCIKRNFGAVANAKACYLIISVDGLDSVVTKFVKTIIIIIHISDTGC